MSHLKHHINVNRHAYLLLKEKLGKKYFPKSFNMILFDSVLSPDILHSFKYLSGYDNFNHMNTKEYNGAFVHALNHYDILVRKLKLKKGALNASWLGHFITDCLEPAHQNNWKLKNKIKRKQKASFHLWVEFNTYNLEIKTKPIVKINESVNDYLSKKAKEIKKLNIAQYYPKEKEKIFELYKQKVIPTQIQAVASIWYKAMCDII